VLGRVVLPRDYEGDALYYVIQKLQFSSRPFADSFVKVTQ